MFRLMRAPDSESSPTPAKKQNHRWARLLLALAIFVVLGLGFRALLPTLTERGAAFASRHYLGLPARIDNVDLFIFRGQIVIEGLSLGATPDGASPWSAAGNPPPIDPATALVHCDRLVISFSWKNLLSKSLLLPKVEIQAPSLRLLRGSDGKIEPLRGARPVAQFSSAKPQPSPAPPWPVEVLAFSLHHPSVEILDVETGKPLLEFSLESFDLDRLSAKGSEIALGTVGVKGPVLRVDRDLVLADSSPDAGAISGDAAPVSAASGYQVKKIEIAGAQFTWITKRGPLDVRFAFRASDVSADQGHRFPIDLTLEVEAAQLHLAGEAGILPPVFDGTFSWTGLPFPPLLLASAPELAPWLRSANSSGNIEIHADVAGAKGPAGVQISGHASLENLALADPGHSATSLQWKRLDAKISDVFIPLAGGPGVRPTARLHFRQITLEEPVLRYTHPSPALFSLLGMSVPEAAQPSATNPPPPAPPAPPAASSTGSFAVDAMIEGLNISGADIEVRDTSVQPDAISTIRNLEITAREVHFPDPSVASFQLQAMLPVSAWLSVKGSLQPGNIGAFTMSLKELDLPTFDAYATTAGASLKAGQLSLEMNLKTQGATIEMENEAVLRKLGISLGNPASFSHQFGMPLGLAIALLSDPSGNIRLKVPVKVDDKGANVSLGPIVASAIRSALVGAITTPLKLMGASLGGPSGNGGLMVSPLKSPPGSADLSPEVSARIRDVSGLLTQRPSMGVVLSGRSSSDETPLIAKQILIETIQAGNDLPALDGVGFLGRHRMEKILAQTAGGGTGKLTDKDQALFEKYLAATNVPRERLDALAKSRAEAARNLLIANKVSANRIRIGDREAAGAPGVVLKFVEFHPPH